MSKVGKTIIAITLPLMICGAFAFWEIWQLDASSRRDLAATFAAEAPIKLQMENPCEYPQPTGRVLELDEAVYRAECFVIENGYTDLPPTADRSKLVPEPVFGGLTERDLIARRNRVEREAFAYERFAFADEGSWNVYFRYPLRAGVDPDSVGYNVIGQAVTMDLYGRQANIHHTWQYMQSPGTRLLRP